MVKFGDAPKLFIWSYKDARQLVFSSEVKNKTVTLFRNVFYLLKHLEVFILSVQDHDTDIDVYTHGLYTV